MTPYDHQIQLAKDGLAILQQYGIAYLAAEERTGKTLSAILIAEQMKAQRILVVTKKKALEGWHETLAAFEHTKQYTVTNYHQALKCTGIYDMVILDEAHNYISAFPKVGKLWREVAPLCKNKPILYLSATPHAQGPQQLFHQFKLSSYSPWKKHGTFYNWFKLYGKPYDIEINGIAIRQYDRCDVELILGTCEHLFVTRTRRELGFEHEPEDELHYVKLGEATRWVYNELLEHNIVELKAGMLVCDTKSKLRVSLHMLEGGVAKIDKQYLVLGNREKIDFILRKFGDTEDLVIMYNYIAELTKLEEVFKKARILQATSFAEGVDLHKHKHLVIYSQDFSTARHTQRRARQANMKRDTPITVHYLLVKKGLSEQVYNTVSVNKRNFVDSVFTKEKI